MHSALRAPVLNQQDLDRAFGPLESREPAPDKLPRIWFIVFSRLLELAREFPKIVRGLSELWPPFRRQMRNIFFMNAAIAGWETTLTVAVAWQLNALAAKWSYLEVVGVITFTVVAFQGL